MNEFETSTQPKKKKFIPVIIIAVILVAIIGGSVYASRSVISNIFQENLLNLKIIITELKTIILTMTLITVLNPTLLLIN